MQHNKTTNKNSVVIKNNGDTNQVYISLTLVIEYCLNLRIKRYLSIQYLQSKKEINIGNTKIIGSISARPFHKYHVNPNQYLLEILKQISKYLKKLS